MPSNVRLTLLLAFSLLMTVLPLQAQSAVHLPLSRRSGRFARRESANLTYLADALRTAEAKFARSFREIQGNRLVRQWQVGEDEDENDQNLIDVAGHANRWYTHLLVGDPPQRLEVEVDMLSPDFYTVVTTSGKGSIYDASSSRSHGPNEHSVHPVCRSPSDEFRLPGLLRPVRLDFPVCTPSKASRQTLANSGSFLGLSPHKSLARLSSPALLDQLVDKGTIEHRVWSLTLLDPESGILSLGGTVAREVEETKTRVELELKHFGDPVVTPEWVAALVENQMKLAMPPASPWDDHFKWTNVQGAAGWWTALMAGVWINGAKVLKNQPVLFDVNVPFILAPPVAAQRFYESIGGSKRLPPPHDSFFAFPCLNHVNIAFEIGGWNFPTMNGDGTAMDALYGPAGGRFSLGKVADGTGYCVGTVVESTMGHKKAWAGSGLRDIWVLGEPFFVGLGVVFDVEKGKVGVRTY